jgi:hypothetical protein
VTVLVDIEVPPDIPPKFELLVLKELPKPPLKKLSLSKIEPIPPKLPNPDLFPDFLLLK